MQVSLENMGNLERRLNVAVPLQEIDSEVENRLKNMVRTVRLHGFRPGKVPYRIIAQQYGGQVRQEVLGDKLQRTFGDAVAEQNLRVAGPPKFEAKPVADGAQDFEYSATFEIYPEFEVGDLSNAAIRRPQLVIGEAEIDKTIEILRKQRMHFEPVQRAAETGDQVTVDYSGAIDGAEFEGGQGKDISVVLGEGRLLPVFEQNISGMQAGESKTFDLDFPADYQGKEVAGKTASFEVTLKQVSAPKLPEVDAEFAKNLGIADSDLDNMRAEIKLNLQREAGRRIQARIKDQVMQALLDATSFSPPRVMVEIDAQRLKENAIRDLQTRGIKAADLPPEALPSFDEPARRRVMLGLILAQLVKGKDLQPQPAQVRTAVSEHARSFEDPEQVVKWYYQSTERLREIESLVVEDNVVAWVLGRAKVSDEPIDFDELMGHQSAARRESNSGEPRGQGDA
ncbi:MAG: trigger factor [Pseudomonadota bacterium]|nr:trigger factor [Pseudomonadota bacterium]